MPKKYSETEYIKFCEDWKDSGKTKKSFCKERNISESALRSWLKKYGDQDSTKESSIKFLPIETSDSKPQSHIVEITLPNGVMLSTEVLSLSVLVKELLR